jgi:CPA1 family monovalent cation:H+ antiporter
MGSFQTLVILMSTAILLVGLAQKLKIPYPLALVLGGAGIGFLPGITPINYDPSLILLIVLPPILYYGAVWIPFREFKQNIGHIFSLAIGLVLATTLIIGVLFKFLFPEYPWALAFTFGAIVSPPDAVAATAIFKRFSIGSRLVTVLEGESLINDASALVLYKLALIALLSGFFSLPEATWSFFKISAGGVVVGLIMGFVFYRFSEYFLEPIVGVVFSFAVPYITYIAADSLGMSGILAVVTNGLYGSRNLVTHHSSLRRVLGYAAWDIFIILLNCFVFILIGSQLSFISRKMTFDEMLLYTAYGFLITFIIILIRMSWVYIEHSLTYLSSRRIRNNVQKRNLVLRDATILGWSGMLGIVSLSAVLAVPPMEGRNTVVFIVFIVILLSMLITGLTLPILLQWLRVEPPQRNRPAHNIRKRLVEIAKREIQRLHATSVLTHEESAFLINYFQSRHLIWEMVSTKGEQIHNLEVARVKVLEVQRQLLIQLWESKEIDDKFLHHLARELDIEETHTVRAEIT